MTFIWVKKRARSTLYLRIADVKKSDLSVNGRFTEQADSSVIQGGAFEKRSGLRGTATRRAAEKSVEEFLKPYQQAKNSN
jgi:hypothetical protein